MKIGILTFYYCKNYGAFLQAFALKSHLESLGHYVFFVDYKMNSLLKRYALFPYYKERSLMGNIKANLCSLFRMQDRLIRIRRFEDFSKKYFTDKTIQNRSDADLIIVGSDQVWNPKLTYGYDEMYYGILSEKYGIPHYTYAVSCPAALLDSSVNAYLYNFKRIGVREQNLQVRLKELFHIESDINIDPTLLFTSPIYDKLIENQPVLAQKYLLSYNLMSNKRQSEYALEYARERKLVCIGMRDKRFQTAGPLEFLSFIKHAEFVLCSSFHGTVFSILFHKKFLCFLSGDERDERIESLLKSLNLEQCICNGDKMEFPDVNWGEVDRKLEAMRKISKRYIANVLKTVGN